MGDLGYLDDQDRFWYCGRKSHRVRTSSGELFTEPCESVICQHPQVHRAALVGVGPPGDQTPVIVVEPWPEYRPTNCVARDQLLGQLRDLAKRHALTRYIEQFLIYPRRLPTDIRHNSKIFREQLGPWAAKQLERLAARRK